MDEKSADYQKQETNLDHYLHEILESCVWNIAVVKGRPKHCNHISCCDCVFKAYGIKECHKKVVDWLKSPYIKSTYKLTQYEYDLLQSYPSKYRFKTIPVLDRMKEKEYFKGIDRDATIEDILANCEITEEE